MLFGSPRKAFFYRTYANSPPAALLSPSRTKVLSLATLTHCFNSFTPFPEFTLCLATSIEAFFGILLCVLLYV